MYHQTGYIEGFTYMGMYHQTWYIEGFAYMCVYVDTMDINKVWYVGRAQITSKIINKVKK